jgi:hypothetical protein
MLCTALIAQSNCIISHPQNTTTLHPNVFFTGIHWLLVTGKGRCAFPGVNHCQGQRQTPQSPPVPSSNRYGVVAGRFTWQQAATQLCSCQQLFVCSQHIYCFSRCRLFWNGLEKLGDSCQVLPVFPACPFTPVLTTDINLVTTKCLANFFHTEDGDGMFRCNIGILLSAPQVKATFLLRIFYVIFCVGGREGGKERAREARERERERGEGWLEHLLELRLPWLRMWRHNYKQKFTDVSVWPTASIFWRQNQTWTTWCPIGPQISKM